MKVAQWYILKETTIVYPKLIPTERNIKRFHYTLATCIDKVSILAAKEGFKEVSTPFSMCPVKWIYEKGDIYKEWNILVSHTGR